MNKIDNIEQQLESLRDQFSSYFKNWEKRYGKVAEYLTKLPDKKVLERKLQQAIERAKNRLTENKKMTN